MGWRKNPYQFDAVENYLKDIFLVVFFFYSVKYTYTNRTDQNSFSICKPNHEF